MAEEEATPLTPHGPEAAHQLEAWESERLDQGRRLEAHWRQSKEHGLQCRRTLESELLAEGAPMPGAARQLEAWETERLDQGRRLEAQWRQSREHGLQSQRIVEAELRALGS